MKVNGSMKKREKILIINTGGTLSAVMKKNGLIPGLSICDMQKELQMVSGDRSSQLQILLLMPWKT